MTETIYTLDGDESAVFAIIRTVAAVKGVRETDLPPLGQTVEADAVQQLLDGNTPHALSVEFEWANCLIEASPQKVTVEECVQEEQAAD